MFNSHGIIKTTSILRKYTIPCILNDPGHARGNEGISHLHVESVVNVSTLRSAPHRCLMVFLIIARISMQRL